MPLIADDAADRARQLLDVSKRLMTLIETERQALERGLTLSGEAVSAELMRLANIYRTEMARIRAEPDLIAAAPRPLREELQAAAAGLQERLDGYLLALGAAREVTEGLITAIAEEVQRQSPALNRYNAGGAYAGAARRAPIALDRRA